MKPNIENFSSNLAGLRQVGIPANLKQIDEQKKLHQIKREAVNQAGFKMQFEIKNRFTGEAEFIAEILADEETDISVKIGLAVRFAVKNKISLAACDLRGAYLFQAELNGADMREADLSGANLYEAELCGADLNCSLLTSADLRKCDLSYTDLDDADLSMADLTGADIVGSTGNMKEVRSLRVDTLPVSFTKDYLQVGGISYPIEQWKNFTNQQMNYFDEECPVFTVLWWEKWKDFIFTAIDLSYGNAK